MRSAFLGEIMAAAFDVVPHGWARCDGALLNVADYPDLFQLLGFTYGGDLVNTFALPDLRGRVIVDNNATTLLPGMAGGEATHVLTTAEMPAHSHNVQTCNSGGVFGSPSGNFLSGSSDASAASLYRPTGPDSTLNTATITNTGNNEAHENMPPYLVVNYFICIEWGCYPVP